jgi:small GTP-binding protein
MPTIDEQITETEELLKRTKRNKATEHYIGTMMAKLSKLRALKEQKSSSGGKSGPGYGVKKRGDATVVLVGFPSVGKSTLLNSLTSAKSKVASYEFTTLTAIPGMLLHKGASIQVIDAPGIIEEAAAGKGRGREVISVVRNADLILIVLDDKVKRLPIILNELYNANIRLDVLPPRIDIKKDIKGGLIIDSLDKQELSLDTIKGVFKEFGLINAQVLLKEKFILERLVDALSPNRVYVPSLIVINKIDSMSKSKLNKLKKKFPKAVFISAEKGVGLLKLKDNIWNALGFMRVYLKRPGHEPDYKEPLILKGRVTVKDVVRGIRKTPELLDYAQVWGKSAKFAGQKVGLKQELQDEDVVTLYFK